MFYKFPDNFLWGTAASAPQTEGASSREGKAPNIYDYWYSIEPEKFFNRVGPENTSNFYYMFKEDIQNMKEINLNSFRTSISWSRLLPDGKNINKKALDFYSEVFKELLSKDIEPIINLFHFDMPMIFQEKGGWESREVVEAYEYYARICFQLFGHRIKRWVTFNEPIVPVEGGYLYQFTYPCVVDFKRAVQVAYNTMIASAKAIKAFREEKNQGEIGIVLNLTPSYPRSNSKEDVEAANLADLLFNRSFLDPSLLGHYPKELIDFIKENRLEPQIEKGDGELLKNHTIDFLGVNYYQPRRIKAKEVNGEKDEKLMPESFFDAYVWPERKMNHYRGWEIYEKGIYDIALNIKNNYNNIPWYVSENGMGVQGEERFKDEKGMIQDDYRIDFLKEHLKWLHKAIEEGCNCFGYHMWTFMDNWSWANAYKNRYGFYSVDIINNFKRTLKKSGLWIKEVISEKGFND